MLTPEKIAEDQKRELEHAMMSLIGLNSNDEFFAHASNHPNIKTDGILNVTRTFSNLDPGQIIHYWDETTYCLTRNKIILVENLSDVYDHVMECNMLPMNEERLFLLTKEEFDDFKAPKAEKEFSSATLTNVTFRAHSLRKIIKSSLNSTHGELDYLSDNT